METLLLLSSTFSSTLAVKFALKQVKRQKSQHWPKGLHTAPSWCSRHTKTSQNEYRHTARLRHSHPQLHIDALFPLSCNNNSINYRLQRQRVTKGVESGAVLFLMSPPWSRKSVAFHYIWVQARPLIHCSSIWGTIEFRQAAVFRMLNGKRQNDSTLKWFAGMRRSPLRAGLIMELMPKQFLPPPPPPPSLALSQKCIKRFFMNVRHVIADVMGSGQPISCKCV